MDDGSTDDTAARARAHPFVRLIQMPNGGLSAARNVGLHAAAGEIVAYVDADVRVDPIVAHVSGPAVRHVQRRRRGRTERGARRRQLVCPVRRARSRRAQSCDARRSRCGARSRLQPRSAARRRSSTSAGSIPSSCAPATMLTCAGGCRSVAARLRSRPPPWSGITIGRLCPAYWRQQVGYGEGEAWLRARHRRRFLRSGVSWRGRIYSPLPFVQSLTASAAALGCMGHGGVSDRVPDGCAPAAGAAAYSPRGRSRRLLLIVAGLTALPISADGAAPLLALAVGVTGASITLPQVRRVRAALRHRAGSLCYRRCGTVLSRVVYRATIAWLHIVQPFARSYGHARGLLRPPVAAAHVDAAEPADPLRRRRRTRAFHFSSASPARNLLERSLDERRHAADTGRRPSARWSASGAAFMSMTAGCPIGISVSPSGRGHGLTCRPSSRITAAGRCLIRARVQRAALAREPSRSSR